MADPQIMIIFEGITLDDVPSLESSTLEQPINEHVVINIPSDGYSNDNSFSFVSKLQFNDGIEDWVKQIDRLVNTLKCCYCHASHRPVYYTIPIVMESQKLISMRKWLFCNRHCAYSMLLRTMHHDFDKLDEMRCNLAEFCRMLSNAGVITYNEMIPWQNIDPPYERLAIYGADSNETYEDYQKMIDSIIALDGLVQDIDRYF